mmetsp:Transcript_3019/g.4495  ORF Transcript_3019/g.4495 Transcript_3019/m.4495 type:complete len:82 (-) Transcript_3019:351-596(-)
MDSRTNNASSLLRYRPTKFLCSTRRVSPPLLFSQYIVESLIVSSNVAHSSEKRSIEIIVFREASIYMDGEATQNQALETPQ